MTEPHGTTLSMTRRIPKHQENILRLCLSRNIWVRLSKFRNSQLAYSANPGKHCMIDVQHGRHVISHICSATTNRCYVLLIPTKNKITSVPNIWYRLCCAYYCGILSEDHHCCARSQLPAAEGMDAVSGEVGIRYTCGKVWVKSDGVYN